MRTRYIGERREGRGQREKRAQGTGQTRDERGETKGEGTGGGGRRGKLGWEEERDRY